jgi:hypothetical protein
MSVSRRALFIRPRPQRPCAAAFHNVLGDLLKQISVVAHGSDRAWAGLGKRAMAAELLQRVADDGVFGRVTPGDDLVMDEPLQLGG